MMGWLLFAVGLIALAIGLPAFGLSAGEDSEAFNRQVGWANIWAGSIAAVGLLLMLSGRSQDQSSELNRRVISLAKAQRDSHSKQLAQLLGTDSFESRSAKLEFVVADARTGRAAPRARTAGDINTIAEYYRKNTSGRLLILGAAGAGKSVLGITLLLELIGDVLSSQPADGVDLRVPVIFNLTSWPRATEFRDWLVDEISVRFRLSPAAARELVRDKRILPILDGLDEMDNEAELPDRAEWAVGQLNEYIATGWQEPLVVIGRSGTQYYFRLRSRFRNMQAISIKAIGVREVEKYLAEHCGAEIMGSIRDELRRESRRQSDMFFAAVSTPWRLAMTVGYINSGNDLRKLLPTANENRMAFSDRLDSELYETFLSTRIRLSGRNAQHQEDRARRHLAMIAHLLNSPKDDEKSSDIVLHDWWRRFGFRVPAWQSRVAFVAVAVQFNLPFDKLPVEDYSPDPNAGWRSWAIPLANLLMLITIAIVTPTQVARPKGVQISRFMSAAGFTRTSLALVFAGGFGYTFSQVASSNALGLAGGMGLLILFAAALGRRTEATKDAASPHDPIRRDFIASVMFGLGMGIFMGAYIADLMGPIAGLHFGFAYFLAMTIGYASGRYFVATVLGSRVGLPLRFSSYLKWATRAGILRVSGISYQFRHRELMKYLSATVPPPPPLPLPGPFGIPVQRLPTWLGGKTEIKP
ncbi:hypothetical protein O7621_00580 [Solwaraspora sp. WMMD937]|uniref:hypothetical protein n=1 Tax=Solwaraspora sp. WMMD937 TaxID=3016090 RepID=UPI00249C6CF2|nr:hypothetical protein [Solwaraspora sp. WMMD937]WFE21925.1 hypothetical protein O7621_00580 [Solwaraspora sp. WMMD937]